MKILVAGCGLIGRRHAKNAAALSEMAVFDIDATRAERCAGEWGGMAFGDLDSALDWGPDGVVVATPPSSHLSIAAQAVKAGADVLIEKPLSSSMDGVEDFLSLTESLGRKVFCVCNLRFHPGTTAIRENLDKIGKLLFAHAHFGSFLPDMRPGVDYRELECVQPGQGGVILDNIHEFDLLMALFGDVTDVSSVSGTLGGLGIEVDDYAVTALRHKNGARSEIRHDWLQKPKRRGCEVVGVNGALIWESVGKAPERGEVKILRSGNGKTEVLWQSDNVDMNAPFVTLLEHFIKGLEGGDAPLASGRMGALVLKTALAACRSAEMAINHDR